MSNIGICEYVIGVVTPNREIWYYVGKYGQDGRELKCDDQFSTFLVDAKRYDDEFDLREEMATLSALACKMMEIQRCPKCKKEFTDHPALSREDYETEICPECGVKEAMDAYQKAHRKIIRRYLLA